MAIYREYHTERECAKCWIKEDFSKLSESWFTERPDFIERFEFRGVEDCEQCDGTGRDWYDETEDCDYCDGTGRELTYTEPPMWSTWFQPDYSLDSEWIEANAEAVCELGFTLIYFDGDLFALGIDGAGYDFYEAHWVPLYRLRGFKWHDGANEEAKNE